MQPSTSSPHSNPERPEALEIDHAAYLASRPYRRQTHAALRRAARKRGHLGSLGVRHERDGSCCSFERWQDTAARIQTALAADGLRVGWVFPAPGGVVVAVPPEEAA